MSRTDHPRYPGTHRAGHALRSYRDRTDLLLGKKDAIAEGVAEFYAPIDLSETYDAPECMDAFESYDDEMAEWEIALLADPPEPEPARFDDDDSEGTYPGAWLTGTVAEAFPDHGYVIEGPGGRDRTSGKADAYLRTYELARLVGINTRHLVEYLRIVGEWVAGPTSYVALPVCEQIVSLADDLQGEYGVRTTWVETLRVPPPPPRRPGAPRHRLA